MALTPTYQSLLLRGTYHQRDNPTKQSLRDNIHLKLTLYWGPGQFDIRFVLLLVIEQ